MSGKCNVIDQHTFDLLQRNKNKCNVLSSARKVHNAKYKRMSSSNSFDLLMYIKRKDTTDEKKQYRKRPTGVPLVQNYFTKRKGKQREGGRKKSQSRLKKAILRTRQKNFHQLDIDAKQKVSNSTLATNLNEREIKETNRQESKVKVLQIHSRRFREYCNNCSTPELKKQVELLLRELNHFQRRAFARNEIKARAHRRFVLGFRQVQTYLQISKVKFVIIATDCEKCDGEEGIDRLISTIKTLCQDQNVPIAYPFERRKLAYILFKKASISCVGILDYDGVRNIFEDLIVALKQAQESYEELVKPNTVSDMVNNTTDIMKNLKI